MDEYAESQAASAATNAPELTVSELAAQLKRTIEDAYAFVRVRGELGRVVLAKSGHLYFDIKDDKAAINSVMWKAGAGRLPFKPEEGLEVVAEGRLSTYPSRSNYQMICEKMRPAGVGALMQLLEERRKKLAAEGLFAPERKKPLPYLPEVIGVVTSPTGAVIRDILHRVRERFPVHVLIWPALVQGERAAAEVEAGIRGFNALKPGGPIPRPDVIIVARGGGSIEDLWPFNEERVVRAAADSEIPLISAVGHETDTTLIDYASDRRAPTPTGAAEMAVPVRAELIAAVEEFGARMGRCLSRGLEKRRLELRSTAARLPKLDAVLQVPRQRLDLASHRFGGALEKLVARKRAAFEQRAARLQAGTLRREVQQKRADVRKAAERLRPVMLRRLAEMRRGLDAQARVLETLSYERVLGRGFALVTGADGHLARSAKTIRQGDALRLRFADGDVLATAGEFEPGAALKGGEAGHHPRNKEPARKPARTIVKTEASGRGAPPAGAASGPQGSLFGEPDPTDRLFFAVFPPPDVAEHMAAVGRELRERLGLTGAVQQTSRLHITTHHLGDYMGLPADVVTKAVQAAERITHAPFEVSFDHAISFGRGTRSKPFVLRGTSGVAGVERFQLALSDTMKGSGLGKWAKPYTPHVTLLYDPKEMAIQEIEPIRWVVSDFVLVHSLLRKTQHIVLNRWRLS